MALRTVRKESDQILLTDDHPAPNTIEAEASASGKVIFWLWSGRENDGRLVSLFGDCHGYVISDTAEVRDYAERLVALCDWIDDATTPS